MRIGKFLARSNIYTNDKTKIICSKLDIKK
jgi:hypothetical protein